jgi:hypothetical protein
MSLSTDSQPCPPTAETIVADRVVDWHREYLVKWVEQPHTANTWESHASIQPPKVIEEYHERKKFISGVIAQPNDIGVVSVEICDAHRHVSHWKYSVRYSDGLVHIAPTSR